MLFPQKSLYLSLDQPEVGCCPFWIPSPLYIEEVHQDTQGPDCLGPYMSEAGLCTQYAVAVRWATSGASSW